MIVRPLALVALATLAVSAADPDMKPYPKADDGMVRHSLKLEKQENEADFKVELILGKTVDTDGVNRHFFGGTLEQKTVEGWGYSYHILPKLGPMAGTRIGVRPGAPLVKTFVKIGGEPYIIRYNSKLPVVVYAPKGVEVRHRIWSTTGTGEPVPEG